MNSSSKTSCPSAWRWSSRAATHRCRPSRPRIQVNGRYLYGAPAAGNRLSGQAYVRPLREAVKALPGYQFGSVTETELNQDLELDEVTLDQAGKAVVDIESRWAEAARRCN
jgi:uncharacterized protein YfaS (alpha-2-macroglobulin family)